MYDIIAKNLYSDEYTVSINKHYGDIEGLPIIIDGTSKIMISAPHCVKHKREDIVKSADIYTYAIGIYLNKALDCPFIYQSGYDGTDANYNSVEISEYKKKLSNYILKNDIKLLIDLHGMSDKHNLLIDIGTYNGQTLCNKDLEFNIIKHNLSMQFKGSVGVNTIFCCSNENNISRYISKTCGVPCIQLEMVLDIRVPDNSENLLLALVNSISQIMYIYKNN